MKKESSSMFQNKDAQLKSCRRQPTMASLFVARLLPDALIETLKESE
jgi:hypothetical protein